MNSSKKSGPSFHPCPRRVEHVEWLVRTFSEPGSIVCDPFVGRGTTAVAALRHDRQFVAMDIEEKYCDGAREWIGHEREQMQLKLYEEMSGHNLEGC